MITVVDHGAGNPAALINMLDHIGAACQVSSDPLAIAGADRLIIPGVGAFDHVMARLGSTGLADGIRDAVQRGAPTLGICLGMQILAEASEEGVLPGLALVRGRSARLIPDASVRLRVPHMGWAGIAVLRSHALLPPEAGPHRFYFCHAYHVVLDDPTLGVASADDGGSPMAMFSTGNIAAVQFHPEKSHRHGMGLLRRFATWEPT